MSGSLCGKGIQRLVTLQVCERFASNFLSHSLYIPPSSSFFLFAIFLVSSTRLARSISSSSAKSSIKLCQTIRLFSSNVSPYSPTMGAVERTMRSMVRQDQRLPRSDTVFGEVLRSYEMSLSSAPEKPLDLGTYNSTLIALLYLQRQEEALTVIQRMLNTDINHITLDSATASVALRILADTGKSLPFALDIWGRISNSGSSVANISHVSLTAEAICSASTVSEAFEWLKSVQSAADMQTLTTLLEHCTRKREGATANTILQHIRDAVQVEPHLRQLNLVIETLVECGDLKGAMVLFRELQMTKQAIPTQHNCSRILMLAASLSPSEEMPKEKLDEMAEEFLSLGVRIDSMAAYDLLKNKDLHPKLLEVFFSHVRPEDEKLSKKHDFFAFCR